MIALFNEINQIESKNVRVNQCKERLLNRMTIKCDQISLSRTTIRDELIVLNQCCLHSLKGHHLDIQQKGFELFIKKNKDYGDSYQLCGIIGILVRILDKLNRLEQLVINDNHEVKDENYEDTLMDLHNYSLLGIMCLDESI
jgi:hypothetical protein|tara:strand:+ start:574 stop:999 length:426 start_codon:yes stop_codon:yes gene_type:complete